MDVICSLAIILVLLALFIFFLLKYSCEEAPDYVEQDDYYRNRWYK